jgi:hypothetical protein
LLDAWSPRPGCILEPAAGDGAIIRAARKYLTHTWCAVEIREECREYLRHDAASTWIADFLTWEPPSSLSPVAVVANPPFARCEEFIRRSARLFPKTDLCFLIRLGFLGSEERVALWRDLGVPDLYVPGTSLRLPFDTITCTDHHAVVVVKYKDHWCRLCQAVGRERQPGDRHNAMSCDLRFRVDVDVDAYAGARSAA